MAVRSGSDRSTFCARGVDANAGSPVGSTTPAIACPRAGFRQDPSSTDPRRADQPIRTSVIKPLLTCRSRVLEPHTFRSPPMTTFEQIDNSHHRDATFVGAEPSSGPTLAGQVEMRPGPGGAKSGKGQDTDNPLTRRRTSFRDARRQRSLPPGACGAGRQPAVRRCSCASACRRSPSRRRS